MIGRGLVVIRHHGQARLDYHVLSPWDLACAKGQDAIVLDAASKWTPDGYLTEEELVAIQSAHCDSEALAKREGIAYHPLASDIVVVLDVVE